MRTIGRRIRSGERERALCSYCGTLWDRDKLFRDAAGLLSCPQEGKGRDAVTLTRANVASALATAQSHRSNPHDPGQYQKEPAVPIGQRTGNLLAEDGTPLTAEDGIYILES